MIDFRYHLVSIIAIFLSLALGLVVGASALQKPIVGKLRDSNKSIAKEKEDLRKQVRSQQRRATYNDQVTAAVAGRLVAGRLKGESVVMVAAPGADENVRTKVADIITKAGARISGNIMIEDQYLDAGRLAQLNDLTTRMRPPNLAMPKGGTPYDRAAAELASVLVTNQASRSGQEDPAAGKVLSAFKTAGFLNYSGKPAARATLTVMIAPSKPGRGEGADADNQALISLVTAFKADGKGAVVVGSPDAADSGGLIKAIRTGDEVDGTVSTVDTADSPTGEVTTVLALAQEAKKKKSGDYGIGSEADAPLPTPVPSVKRQR